MSQDLRQSGSSCFLSVFLAYFLEHVVFRICTKFRVSQISRSVRAPAFGGERRSYSLGKLHSFTEMQTSPRARVRFSLAVFHSQFSLPLFSGQAKRSNFSSSHSPTPFCSCASYKHVHERKHTHDADKIITRDKGTCITAHSLTAY